MSRAAASPSPTRIAAAPSPTLISSGLAERVRRLSAAMTSVSPPPRNAAISAEVPARWLAATSSAATSLFRLSASATMPAWSRSAKGKLVEANCSAPIVPRSRSASASRAASTAMVTASSSQLQMARSPLACALSAGLNQAFASAMARRDSRSRGI